MTAPRPRFSAVAESGLLVRFAETISDSAHAAVLALDQALAADPPPGLRESVPAYVSLMLVFDPLITDHGAMEQAVLARLMRATAAPETPAHHVVQVCYDADLSPDLAAVCTQTGLAPEAAIALHLAGNYRVFMYGFAPGYAYLAGVPAALQLPRKPAPIRNIPAGSVLIAGPQCLVSTLKMPTGWWIIGRSPTAILTPDPGRPFLFDVGDSVGFQRISRADFDRRHKGAHSHG